MNNINIKIIFIFFTCYSKILYANDICPAVETLQNLSRQYKLNPSSGKSDEIKDFVITGKYTGEFGTYSGLNYQRKATTQERKIIFQAIIQTTLKPSSSYLGKVKKYAQLLSDLELGKEKNEHHEKDFIHRSISYVVAFLSVEETLYRDQRLDWLGFKQKVLNDSKTSFPSNTFDSTFIDNLYFEKAFQEAFLNVTGKNLSFIDSHPQELKKPGNEWKAETINKLKSSPDQYCALDSEYFLGCSSIKIVTGDWDKPVAHVLINDPVRDIICKLAQEIGIGDHFASQMTYKGQKFEQFVQLGSPIATVDREAKEILQHKKGKFDDVTIVRIKHDKDIEKILKHIHPNSIDRLFIEQIVLGTSDSTGRNFLFQYKDKGLQLVRIDYADSFTATTYFFGENFEEAFKPFSSYGINILKNFVALIPNDEIWEVYLEESKRYYDQRILEAKEYSKTLEQDMAKRQIGHVMFHKGVYQDRIRILGWMVQEGFFDCHPSRFETLIAMTYFGMREYLSRLPQRLSFPECYFVDKYFMYNGEHVRTSATVKTRKLVTLSSVYKKFVPPFLEQKGVKYFEPGDPYIPVTESVIRQAIHDWMNTPDFLDLPGVKEVVQNLNENEKRILQI